MPRRSLTLLAVLASPWAVSATCAPQPSGIPHSTNNPDSAAAFLKDVYYSTLANNASTPNSYDAVFINATASVNAAGYMGYRALSSYSVQECATQCDDTLGCTSFNLYFERDPSVRPDSPNCANPSSITNVKCAMWRNEISRADATNSGQWRGKFQVAIAGSNGYVKQSSSWPDTPMTVSGRDIISASGKKVLFAGVNWPGHMEAMIPEGLQYNSIEGIVDFIKDLGMNIVRLSWAIEMVDDIYEGTPDQTLRGTLINALGEQNGTKVLAQILQHNPQFSESTTRLEVFDAVAAALASQQIWTHLDNQVSKASWCCGSTDGNAWFGDKYFNVYNWTRALGFMANHAKQWEGFASIDLRNELRPTSDPSQPQTWNDWMDNMIPAANTIYGNNTQPLIFFSGDHYDTDDQYFIERQTWNDVTFTPAAYSFEKKIVYEIHYYDESATACGGDQSGLYKNAYCAMNLTDTSCPNHGPVVMSEFGFDNQNNAWTQPYAQCVKTVLTGAPGGPGGWMQWVISGSYYIRYGIQDDDEQWGILNHNWTTWRNPAAAENFTMALVRETLG